MKAKTYFVMILLVAVFLMASLLGCKATPSPAPPPTTPTSTAKPTSAPAPTSTPTPAPSPKPSPTPTAAAQPFYKGKTITFVVPYAPGGATDISARLWSKHLPKYIPGNPNIIVNNMPGAGSLIGSNFAYNAKPDGTTLMVGSASSYFGSLFKAPEAKYDYRKMAMVLATSSGVTFYAKTGNIKTPYDLTKPEKKWIFGSSTAGVYIWFFVTANELMAIPTEKVMAVYSGAGPMRLAFWSDEVTLVAEGAQGYKSAIEPYVKKGEVMPVFSTGILNAAGNIVRDPLFPDLPTFLEVAERVTGKPVPDGKPLEAMKGLMGSLSYITQMLVPPGVPDEAVKALWGAATQMIKDPAYLKDAEPVAAVPPFVQGGETLNKTFHSQFGMADETAKWIMDLVWEKYRIKPVG